MPPALEEFKFGERLSQNLLVSRPLLHLLGEENLVHLRPSLTHVLRIGTIFPPSLPSATPLLFDLQFHPPRQRRRPIPQKHDPPRLGEREVRRESPVVEFVLLQNLPVVGVGGVQPGALPGGAAAPSQAEQADRKRVGKAKRG